MVTLGEVKVGLGLVKAAADFILRRTPKAKDQRYRREMARLVLEQIPLKESGSFTESGILIPHEENLLKPHEYLLRHAIPTMRPQGGKKYFATWSEARARLLEIIEERLAGKVSLDLPRKEP